MRLNSVILADDSESCDIADLFVMMKNSTVQLLEQYSTSHEDFATENYTYLSDTITKQNLSEKMSLVNSDSFMCFWFGHGKDGCFRIGSEDVVTTTDNYYVFSNALIYTFSCLNGNDLADALELANTCDLRYEIIDASDIFDQYQAAGQQDCGHGGQPPVVSRFASRLYS